jgi:O-antigen/teichoic acid export membrane protein
MWRLWSVYGVSSILSRSIAFLLLPLYTRVLTPQEYGIRAMVALGLELILLLVACGLKEGINRFYTSRDATAVSPEQAASTGIIAHAALIGLGVAVGLVFAPWLAGPLLGDAALAPFLRLGLIAGFFMHVQEAAFVYLRARQRARTVAMASVGGLIAMVLLNLLFVVVLRTGVAGIFYAEMLVFGVSGVFFTVRALRELGVTVAPPVVRAMVRFGAPLMFVPFTWLVVSRTDVLFLTHYGSLAYVGVYALAVQCAQVLQFAVTTPFRNFWDPVQFQLARDPAGSATFRRMFQWVTFTAVVAAFACAVAADEVISIMAAPAFHAAASVVPLVLVAYVFEALHLFFNAALLVRNRTALAAVVAVVTAVVNIGANALLVPHYLAYGAAAARVIAMAVMVAATYVLARRLWPQPVDFAALAKVAGWAIALFAVASNLPDLPLVVTIVVKGALVVALVALAIWSGALERADAARAWSLVRGRLPLRGRAPRLREGETG